MSGTTGNDETPKGTSWRGHIDFQSLVDGLPALIFVCDAGGACVFANTEVQKATGLSERDWLGGGWISAIHRDDRTRVARAWGRAISASEPFELEYRIQTATGDHEWYLVRARPVREDRRIQYWIGHATDIDDRRREGEVKTAEIAAEAERKEVERRQAEEFAARLIDANADVIHTLSLDGRLLTVNVSGAATRPLDVDELVLGRSWIGGWQTAEARALAANAVSDAAKGSIGRFTAPFVSASGDRRWWNVAITPMPDAHGQVQSLLCVSRDVTEGRSALERLQLITSTAREGFYQYDWENWRLLYASPAYEEIWGYPAEHFQGDPDVYRRCIHPDDYDAVEESWTRIGLGVSRRIEFRVIHPDGQVRWVRDLAYPIHNDHGQVTQVVGSVEDITEARKTEERLRLVTGTVREGFYITDITTGQGIYSSPAADEIWGRRIADTLHVPFVFLDWIHPEDRPIIDTAIASEQRGEASRSIYRIVRPDGEVRVVRDLCYPIPDEKGRMTQVVGSIEDITEVQEAQERFRLIAETVREGFYLFDVEKGDILYGNPSLDRIWGRPFMEAGAQRFGFLDWVHAGDRAQLLQGMEEARQGRQTRTTFRIVHPDGSIRHLRDLCQPIVDASGRVTKVVGTVEDVTETLRTEEQLRLITETVQEGFYQTDIATGRSLYSSPSCDRILGRSARILEQEPSIYLDWVHPEDRPIVREAMARERQGEPNRIVYRIVRPDGEIRWVRDLNHPLVDAQGRAVQTVGTIEDITEVKAAETRAEAMSQERYRSIFELAAVGIARVSLEGRILEANQRFAEVLHWPADELLEKTAQDVAHPEDFVEAWDRTRAILCRELPSFSIPMRYRTADGGWVSTRLTVSPAYDTKGQLDHLVSVVTPLEEPEWRPTHMAPSVRLTVAGE